MITLKKIRILCLAISLIFLQRLLPFVHAHFDVSASSAQASGLHLHPLNHHATHTVAKSDDQFSSAIQADHQDLQLVTIDKGLIKTLELPSFVAILFAMLLLSKALIIIRRLVPPAHQLPHPFHVYAAIHPRAPPFF